MALFRITCSRCGLTATHIQSGDRGVTSFDTDEGAARCEEGKAAKLAGDSVPARVVQCEHLKQALQAHFAAPTPQA
jgi:hypothetical protein